MKAEAFQYYSDQLLTEIGLVLFMAVFIGVFFWSRRPAAKSIYAKMSQLPLEGDSKS